MSLSGIVGTLVEAWAELRIHKTRILLALIGVALSVAALTTVVGLGNMVRESIAQGSEAQSGRPATLSVMMYSPDGAGPDPALATAAYREMTERYAVEYSSLIYQTMVPFQLPNGVTQTQTMVVDADYEVMRRVPMAQGSWFTAADGQRLAPAVVINEAFYTSLGSPDLRSHPVLPISLDHEVNAVVVGVNRDRYEGEFPQAIMLSEAYDRLGMEAANPSMELWVPEELSDSLAATLTADLTAQFPGMQVEAYRSDYAAWGDPFGGLQWAVGGIAGLVMLLGAVGLLNISMVTVKYRVREIGIRRSFGATSGRIFFGVMLESVVATFVAGVLGVMAAVAVVKLPVVQRAVASGLTELPPFPLEAALIGLGAATAVGALAGLIPAVVAVRVKVIDAIRY
ncbi:putative ABC transport system permease protein [Arthrobacter sp. UYP6]|uniref:ABC transporter permease n=1 Tax=Arthrobacter sp. UYP6 TaxID=1756378 RepID=UPI00339B4DA1